MAGKINIQFRYKKGGRIFSRSCVFTRNLVTLLLDKLSCRVQEYQVFEDWIEIDDVVNLVKKKSSAIELSFTDRNAGDRLIETANMVTGYRNFKHLHNKGILTRPRIDY
ncbi:MAG TPA: hypothetical protein G4O15_09755 [Dehalococcoidia bacterium]|nr:hypothetical protein [Dehalococcoidia bacterium]